MGSPIVLLSSFLISRKGSNALISTNKNASFVTADQSQPWKLTHCQSPVILSLSLSFWSQGHSQVFQILHLPICYRAYIMIKKSDQSLNFHTIRTVRDLFIFDLPRLQPGGTNGPWHLTILIRIKTINWPLIMKIHILWCSFQAYLTFRVN